MGGKKNKQGRYPSFIRAYPSAWHLQEIDNSGVQGIKNPDIVASSLYNCISPSCLYLTVDAWSQSSLFPTECLFNQAS